MEHIRRVFAWRASLTLFIIFLVLLPPVAIDIDWASDNDFPEPVSTETTSRIFVGTKHASTGFTLIAPFAQNNVYLVDGSGAIVHTWQSGRSTKGTVQLLEDGTLLRGRSGGNGQPDGIHILDWDGSVLWDYQPPKEFKWHHDIEPLPNGNILINTMVDYTDAQAIEMGRDPAITPELLHVDPIVEIKPNGTNGGDIVWRWDPSDHIIQDYNPSKPNYGVVKDHPELIDFNYPGEFLTDWQHSNSVSYNAELDQVMITNRNTDEIWVIDHNTTTAEAAEHTGGAHGRGGDLLYRWGNPEAYDSGNASNHVLYGPHDAHWIGPGLPGEGNIIIFNNGMNAYLTRPEGKISTVEELVPPINTTGGYDLSPGSTYGPSDSAWRYTADPPESFYGWAMGGVERLPNGNTLVCGGSSGRTFEVTPDDEVVWDYRSIGPFKTSRYYPPFLGEISALDATEDVMLRLNVSSYMSDLDTDHEALVLGENSPYANISGHELLLQYPNGITTDVINLTVSDGIFEVGREVRVRIRPVNDPPVLAPIPTITATEAVPYFLDLETIISDPDTDIIAMDVTVNSSYATVDGGELRLLYPNGVLADRVLLRVSDGEYEAQTEFLVNVTPVDDPPTVDPIPDQSGFEDVPWTIDLGRYIRDIDTPLKNISVASTSQYTRVSGLNLTLLYPEGVTRDAVYLTISDRKSYTFAAFNVTVEPVNDPPEIGDLPPLNITEDEPFLLDVGPAIFDIDTPVEELTLRVDSPFVVVENHTLVLLYPGGVLHDEVVVELWDENLHASTTLVVSVEPVNDAPVIGALPPLTVREDEPFSLDLGSYITDVDTPMEELTLRVASPFVEVDDHALVLLYPDGVHRDEVVVEVWDGALRARATLVVVVEPVNDPPWWATVPGISAVEDVEGEFELGWYMNDIDTSLEELAVEVASSYGSIEGHTFRFVYPDGVLREEVSFTLSDGEFQAVLLVNVTVSPVNDAPELSGARVDPSEGSAGTSFRFWVVFKDVDMGSDVPVVEVVIDGVPFRCGLDELSAGSYGEGVVYYVERELGPGVHSFYFTADDGDGGKVTTETLSVTMKGSTDAGDRSDMTTIIISLLVIVGALALVTFLLVRRRRSS